jgi:MinD-like ATPase involved in chromosome partitioning or flagellar assembly
MTEPTIALVFSPEPWVERLHRHLVDHGGARVHQIVLDPVLALQEPYDVLVVSHRWPGLTARLVSSLAQRGRTVLGVYDGDEPASRASLAALHVDAVIASDVDMAQFVAMIGALHVPRVDRSVDPATDVVSGATSSLARGGGRAAGRIQGALVVTGLPGAGATEIAIGIAGASARRRPTALVDAHERAPSVAERLGLTLGAGALRAAAAVDQRRGEWDGSLVRIAPNLEVLPGISRSGSRAIVDADQVAAAFTALGASGRAVVADVAGDGSHPIGRAAMAQADVVAFVLGATPIGVTRTLSWAAQHPEVTDSDLLHLVVNRAPRDRFKRGELERELVRTLGPVVTTFVPADERVEAAAWSGSLAARGGFADAIGRLAERIGVRAVPRRSAGRPASRRGRRAA